MRADLWVTCPSRASFKARSSRPFKASFHLLAEALEDLAGGLLDHGRQDGLAEGCDSCFLDRWIFSCVFMGFLLLGCETKKPRRK